MTETEEQDQADAALAGLAGGAMSPCPKCGAKTVSDHVYSADREHPDQRYSCDTCRLMWEIFFPEGTMRMPGEAGDDMKGLVPFDPVGHQKKWQWGQETRMRPNFTFEDTLEWVSDGSRSMYNFRFRRESTGTTVGIMGADFKLFLPLMVQGKITGKFTFRNRGGCSGVTLFKEKKPRAPRKSRAKKRA